MNSAAATTAAHIIPWSWVEANEVAEEITLDELHTLLAADKAPMIFPRKGAPRHLTLDAYLPAGSRRVRFERQDRDGWMIDGSVLVGDGGRFEPIFSFYTARRIVRVAPIAR